ncbi:MAG: hypothetical protein WBP64_12205 [Nitrososphaeraceae archaeon]
MLQYALLTIKGDITSKPQAWNGAGTTVKASIENGTLIDPSTPSKKYVVFGAVIMTVHKISFNGTLVTKIAPGYEKYQDLSFELPVRAAIRQDLDNGSKAIESTLGGTDPYTVSQSLITIDGNSTRKVTGRFIYIVNPGLDEANIVVVFDSVSK